MMRKGNKVRVNVFFTVLNLKTTDAELCNAD